MRTVTAQELKNNFDDILDIINDGEIFEITDEHGTPLALFFPYNEYQSAQEALEISCI